MRTLCRSGPWLLALGVALAGCSNSSDPATKGPAKTDASSVPEANAGAADVTLVVEGMT